MPFYQKLGKIPHKRHTQFRQQNGSLFHEQLFGTIGFDGMSSLMYHHFPPTQVKAILGKVDLSPEIAEEKSLQAKSFTGFNVVPTADYIKSRVPVLVNNDCHISLAAPTKSQTDYFYKNTDADEVIFIHKGTGTL